ncbi:hypothetical protein pb186bvf_001186 [Paramecium bursaria]
MIIQLRKPDQLVDRLGKAIQEKNLKSINRAEYLVQVHKIHEITLAIQYSRNQKTISSSTIIYI